MYIARSAWRSRSSGSVWLSEVTAAPMLACITTWRPWNSNGERSDSRIRSAARRVPSSVVSSSRIANSSPPKRAVVSSGRMTARSRSATATSSWSPASWPRLSFTVLKSSRSEKSTETAPWLRACRASACATRSRKRARLARPVSESWKAWCCSWSSSCFRSVMSWIRALKRIESPVPTGQIVSSAENSCPSRCSAVTSIRLPTSRPSPVAM